MNYFTTIVIGLAILYMGNTVWTMYGIFNPETCKSGTKYCFSPFNNAAEKHKWTVKVYSSLNPSKFNPFKDKKELTLKNFDFESSLTKSINITIPEKTRNNGTLYLYVNLYLSKSSQVGDYATTQSTEVTSYLVPVTYFKLMKDDENKTADNSTSSIPVTHLRPKVHFQVMNQDFNLNGKAFPPELQGLVSVVDQSKYLPILYINELTYNTRDLKLIPSNATEMTIEISYSPISIGLLRLWVMLDQSMAMLRELGFTEKDTDELKGIFTDTSITFLALTFFVSTFHLLFDFLAFKHDIQYWQKRKSMEGLSSHTVVYRCVSTVIIFLFLLDQGTSYIVLGPALVGSVIEIWKVKKAVKLRVVFHSWRPSLYMDARSENEKTTESYDQQAIKYLSYVLYPLCIIGAVYSLFYMPHKSWYSWVIQSLVNGVYAFGFLFMLPQLFINYKLKSVAHLPWKAFTYKAFNTFIDDVFAFIIHMPTSHRLACFRDDIVFFCYLYQRWLYPIDKSRVNEFGISYDDEDKKEK